MQIRLITDTDRPALLEVYRQSEDFLALGPNPSASLEMVEADRKLSRDQGGEFYGLFDEEGTLMGVLDLIRTGYKGDPACAYLELLMIGAPYRGHGLGEAAFTWMEAELRHTPGLRTLKAGVQVNNPGAVRFWQRMGFRITSPARLLPDGTTCYDLEKAI
jgi:RimJ/RimL family protein N-acetyltransferase